LAIRPRSGEKVLQPLELSLAGERSQAGLGPFQLQLLFAGYILSTLVYDARDISLVKTL
jgi:hypothetical protein